jgi:DNA primase
MTVPPSLDLPEGRYLAQRGLDLELAARHHVRVLSDLERTQEVSPGLFDAGGLFSKDGWFLFHAHRLLFFFFQGDHPVYVCGRDVTGRSQAKELSPVGLHSPVPFNVNLLDGHPDAVHICEGCIDTLSALQLGHPAIGVPGTCSFRQEWFPLLRGVKQARVLFDNDESGRRQGAELAAQLRLHGIPAELFHPATGKDMNDHLLNLQKKGLTP